MKTCLTLVQLYINYDYTDFISPSPCFGVLPKALALQTKCIKFIVPMVHTISI